MGINVTKSFLPPFEEYEKYLRSIWKNGQLTNNGPLAKKLELRLKRRLKLPNIQLVSNGTMALQLAIRALDITEGEIITTPFSYVATTSAILWERCKPVFVDINPETYCIDVDKIESAITPRTKAILAVHVFGFPAEVAKIQKIADRNGLKVIYDAAHAFGVEIGDDSLLNNGDISICSFHATKLFHTIEGGCLVTPHEDTDRKIGLIKRFGHHGDDHQMLGINAKIAETQAAMGLVNLNHIDDIIGQRKYASDLYDSLITSSITKPKKFKGVKRNYAYYPVLFKTEHSLLRSLRSLESEEIFPRRYFYPSLNTLPYLEDHQECPVSEDISKRILCLPLFAGIKDSTVKRITNLLVA